MKKKYVLYILITLIALVGFFSPTGKAQAIACDVGSTTSPTGCTPMGTCTISYQRSSLGSPTLNTIIFSVTRTSQTDCTVPTNAPEGSTPQWQQDTLSGTQSAVTAATTPTNFQDEATGEACLSISSGTVAGCAKQLFYYVIYIPSTVILTISATFFDALIAIALSSTMFASNFMGTAWATVRDISNIFFILILLYIAIQVVLDIGGHDAKKMITKVIIVALLINFSMFFTKVVIDSSNILALVFYNKISASAAPTNATNISDKNMSGSLYQAFDPTSNLNEDFWTAAKAMTVAGKPTTPSNYVPAGTMIGVILIAVAVMLFAAYAFFIAGIAFVGRMVELFILIIFSPFAFMSSTTPLLSGVEYLGWSSWLKRLLKVSFMAPIFMFFMYLILLLATGGSNGARGGVFGTFVQQNTGGVIQRLLSIVIPAMFILILLLKATDFAKKGSGAIGEKLAGAARAVGGLALGAATAGAGTLALGGAATVGRATIGRAGAAVASSKLASKWEAAGWGGERFKKVATAVGGASFDVRGVKIAGKTLAGATGMNLGEAQKGGFEARRKADVEKRQRRAEGLKVKEDEPLKQALNKTEADLQRLLNENSKELSEFDKLITKKREALNDATARFGGGSDEAKAAGLELQNVKDRRKALKDGINYSGDKDINGNVTGVNAKDYSDRNAGIDPTTSRIRTMNYMEDQELRDRKQAIDDENRARLRTYAETTESGLGRMKDFILSGGQNSYKGSREAAHKIRMGVKVEEKH